MTDETARYRGAQAASEWRELEQAFADVRAGFLETIATSGLGDTDFREHTFKSIFVLDAVKQRLLAVASGQAMAEHDDLIANILAGRDGS